MATKGKKTKKAVDKNKIIKDSGVEKIFRYAIRTKRFIGGIGKLEKSGAITKINGQVDKYGVTSKGDEYIIIDNFFHKPRRGTKKRWQMVLVKNLITLNENGWSHIRKSA